MRRRDRELAERLEGAIKAMQPAQSTTSHTGSIQLCRKLLTHSIMDSPILTAVFTGLMLMAGNKGEVLITSLSKLAHAMGHEQYAAALTMLETEHGVIISEIADNDIYIKIINWSK